MVLLQLQCTYEAKVNDEVWCIKKPSYTDSIARLNYLQSIPSIEGVIEYKKFPLENHFGTAYYPDLSSVKVPAVLKVIKSIHSDLSTITVTP